MLGYHHFILYENKETHLVDSYAAISNSSSTGAILKTIASTLSANAALFFDIFPIIEIHLQCLKSPLTADIINPLHMSKPKRPHMLILYKYTF